MLSGAQREVPLHLQLAELLREEIVAQDYRPGDQLPSQQHLAARYRTSLITVKRALAELKAEGIIYGEPGKGMYVNLPVASQLPESQNGTTVGVIIYPSINPFWGEIASAVCEAAAEEGWGVVLEDGHAAEGVLSVEEFANSEMPGGFVVGVRLPPDRLRSGLAPLRETGLPFVMVSYTDDASVDYVGVDHVRGAYLATRHLIELGYRSIWYVTPDVSHPLSGLRYQGFLWAVGQDGAVRTNVFGPEPGERLPVNRYRAGYELGLRMAELEELPEACFAFSDLVALGLIRALRENAIEVPDEVAVVGFDDMALAKLAVVPLTTVRQPLREIGYRSVEILGRRLKGERGPTRILLEPELIVRDSCGANLRW